MSKLDDTMELPRPIETEMPEVYGDFLKLDNDKIDPADVMPVKAICESED